MKHNKINSQVLVEIVCLLMFSAVYLYMAITGKYLVYITPRMKPYLFFLAIVMILFAIALIYKIHSFSYKKHIAHCLVIIIPVLSLIVPHNATGKVSNTTGTTLLKGNTSLTSSIQSTKQNENNNSTVSTDQNVNQDDDSNSKTVTYDDGYGNNLSLHGCNDDLKTIVINDDEFLQWINVLFNNIDKFTDYQVTMTGSVFKDLDNLNDDEFIPARLVMTCCIADLVPCGLICNYSNAKDLEKDSWVTVTGRLIKGKYNGNVEPQLIITELSKAKPKEGYLYPY